jgi:hypothetical protein
MNRFRSLSQYIRKHIQVMGIKVYLPEDDKCEIKQNIKETLKPIVIRRDDKKEVKITEKKEIMPRTNFIKIEISKPEKNQKY